jgi:hypothetical protein
MKLNKLLYLIPLLLFACQAETVPAKTLTSNNFCKQTSEYAEHVMYLRQHKVPYSSVVGIVDSAENIDQSASEMLIAIAELAYISKVEPTEKQKDLVVKEFSNKIYSMCMED